MAVLKTWIPTPDLTRYARYRGGTIHMVLFLWSYAAPALGPQTCSFAGFIGDTLDDH